MPDISEPALETIQQDYDELAPEMAHIVVPVKLDGPATVHELPARGAYSRSINTDPAITAEVASFDLRRKYLIVIATTPTYIGHDKRLVDGGDVGQIPAGVPITIPTAAQTFCRAVAAAGILSYWAGSWAD